MNRIIIDETIQLDRTTISSSKISMPYIGTKVSHDFLKKFLTCPCIIKNVTIQDMKEN